MRTHRPPPRAKFPARAELRGFTLIEMMIVVVIVGVLATLATFGVLKYVRSSRTGEAFAMVVDIKAAEEAARDEIFAYIGEDDFEMWHPHDDPEDQKRNWLIPDASANDATRNFRSLGVISSGPVYFVYAVVAGGADDGIPALPDGMEPVGLPADPTEPWYVVVARGDLDGDDVDSFVLGHSFGSDLIVQREGE